MPELRVTLPLPPSANRYWRTYQGRTVRSADATSYIALVAAELRGQRQIPDTARVHLTLRVWCDKRRDLSNCLKVTEDALAQALGWDDRQTAEIHLYKHEEPCRKQQHACVHLAWDDAAIPSHCAWCEAAPSQDATSGICQYHKRDVLATVRREHAGA